LAILPEMTGTTCVNGISWTLYDNPMLILDDTTMSFEAGLRNGDPLSMDLTTYVLSFIPNR